MIYKLVLLVTTQEEELLIEISILINLYNLTINRCNVASRLGLIYISFSAYVRTCFIRNAKAKIGVSSRQNQGSTLFTQEIRSIITVTLAWNSIGVAAVGRLPNTYSIGTIRKLFNTCSIWTVRSFYITSSIFKTVSRILIKLTAAPRRYL